MIAALLAVALLAASQPAIERSRVEHAHTRVHDELSAVRIAVQDLLASDDPVPPGAPGARRELTLRLPGRSVASSGVRRVELGPLEGRPDRLAWRVGDGRRRDLRVPVDVRRPGGGPMVLREPGRHRLVLELVTVRGSAAVVVRRPKFMPEDGPSPPHARGGGRAGRRVPV